MKYIEPGKSVTINSRNDLWMDIEARPYVTTDINNPVICIFIRKTKAGLFQVRMLDLPKMTKSFPPKNVDKFN